MVALALLLAARPTLADDEKAPWVVGVSEEAKTAAKALLAEGNELFLEHKYADALDRYRRALARWDHPAIRFNIVRCQIQLDHPVEAAENLEIALKYGSAPLEDSVYAEAIAYQKLLATQVGELEVQCRQAGVSLTVDGQPVLDCPGSVTRRVRPGHHQVVGKKAGFMTTTNDAIVVGGQVEHVAIVLAPVSRGEILVHRWPTWVPWVVFGGGLALVGGGILLDEVASSKMADYDRALARDCGTTGCSPGSNPVPPADAQLESSAKAYNAAGSVVLTAGAVAAVTGGVLLYLNRGRIVYKDVEVAPTRGGGAMTLTLSF